MYDRLRLRVDLLVEVEREPVLARERREPEGERHERDRREGEDLERAAGRGLSGRVRAACGAWLARKATASTTANTSSSADGRRRIADPDPRALEAPGRERHEPDRGEPRSRERERHAASVK